MAATADRDDASQASVRLAFQLRLQLLESLVGIDGQSAQHHHQDVDDRGSIVRRGQNVASQLQDAVDKCGSESIKRFLDAYDLHAPLLVPQLPLPPPNGSELTPRARAVLVLEAEQDIRTLERQLREIDVLEKRGAASAGNLEACNALEPRLQQLRAALPRIANGYEAIERGAEELVAMYSNYVDAVSELFVAWDAALSDAERTVARLEREKQNQ